MSLEAIASPLLSVVEKVSPGQMEKGAPYEKKKGVFKRYMRLHKKMHDRANESFVPIKLRMLQVAKLDKYGECLNFDTLHLISLCQCALFPQHSRIKRRLAWI